MAQAATVSQTVLAGGGAAGSTNGVARNSDAPSRYSRREVK